MDISFTNFLPNVISEDEVEISSLWKTNITLSSPQKVVVKASSGKGKSTLVSVLFGLRKDYSGSLFFDGKNSLEISKNEWTVIRRSKISLVFQDLQLLSNLTVKENLIVKNDLTNSYTESEIYSMIEKVGLSKKWEINCGKLSLGQQQRVAIVRALLQPFEWIVLDEPFSHLDIKNSEICMELIESRCEKLGAGFILTSLDKNENLKFDKE